MYRAQGPDGAARRRRTSTAARTARRSIRRSGRASYLFNATIAGIEQRRRAPDRRLQSAPRGGVLNARIRKRWRAGQVPGRRDRRDGRSDLPLRLSRRRPGDAGRARRRQAQLRRGAEERRASADHRRRRARWRGRTARRSRRWRPRPRIELGAVKDGWNGFCVLHTAASRVGALDIGFVPGEGGLNAAAMAKAGALDVLFLLGADEIDVAARRLRRLHRHPWRPRRAPRRRDPAGRGLYRKVRHSTSTPKAACSWPTAPASRRAMRARTGRSCARCPTCSAQKLPYDSLAQLRAGAVRGASASGAHRRRSRRAMPADIAPARGARRRRSTRRRSRSPIDDFYLTNPIARASAVMAECSALAEGRAAMTAAE